MKVQLHRLSPLEAVGLVGEFVTDPAGRVTAVPPAPLGGGGANHTTIVGDYEWTFAVADYFAALSSSSSFVAIIRGGGGRARGDTYTSPFWNVRIRVQVENPDEHYHVPLQVSPWSYSICHS